MTTVHPGVVPLVNAAWDSPAISPAMLVAIRQAADDMGVDPHLLMALAWRESRFDPAAANRLSSACGLLQFTSETWLQNVREFGARHGAAEYATAVERGPSGEMVIRDKDTREAVLKLRDDPVLSARLATEAMARQRAAMKASLGRRATSADFFLLHVLGPTGSARFLTSMAERPSASCLEFASLRVLRNAGLLASDGRKHLQGDPHHAGGPSHPLRTAAGGGARAINARKR